MTSSVVSLVISLVLGLVIHRVKVWKMSLLTHVMFTVSIIIFISDIPTEDHIYTKESPAPVTLDIGYVMCQTFYGSIYLVNSVLFAKSIVSCTLSRGVLSGALGFCTSFGVLLIDGVGGQIYGYDKRNPFFMILASECFAILLILVLKLTNQLNI